MLSMRIAIRYCLLAAQLPLSLLLGVHRCSWHSPVIQAVLASAATSGLEEATASDVVAAKQPQMPPHHAFMVLLDENSC